MLSRGLDPEIGEVAHCAIRVWPKLQARARMLAQQPTCRLFERGSLPLACFSLSERLVHLPTSRRSSRGERQSLVDEVQGGRHLFHSQAAHDASPSMRMDPFQELSIGAEKVVLELALPLYEALLAVRDVGNEPASRASRRASRAMAPIVDRPT